MPPVDAAEDTCFRVLAPAAQAWEGCEDHVALRIGGDWHFIAPREGMKFFDSTAGHSLFFRSGWHVAALPTIPANGAVIDVEARTAIGQIIAALSDLGIFSKLGA